MQKIFDRSVRARAALVSVIPKGGDEEEHEIALEELSRLADTAGADTVFSLVQKMQDPDPATYIGSGKLSELASLCAANDIDVVVFNCELSPSQIRNIEEKIDGVSVIDRSMLILDIFALHATSAEGKLQVDLAQLKYTVPRLVGKGNEMSRLGGGIGTRGPGESQLETDRRHIKRRMDALTAQLKELAENRETQRASRDRSGIFKFGIAGYTNAGKSTLLNYLTGAGILAEDKLFATLDPTTRKFALPSGTQVLLTDTVGFIRELPHHLINAFKSTLDEVVLADAILVVIDASDPNAHSQLGVTQSLLDELGASSKPIVYVMNKCDVMDTQLLGTKSDDTVFVSALTGQGIDELVAVMENVVSRSKRRVKFMFPHDRSGDASKLYSSAGIVVLGTEYTESGTVISAVCDERTAGKFKEYIVGE